MRNPERLWRALEAIPGLSAVRAEWRHWLGDDLAWAEQLLLRPTGDKATVFPSCHGEPYQIVDHGGGRYKAVHPDGEPSLDLATSDITILQLDVVKLAGLLCAAFGFEAEPFVRAPVMGRYRIGTWRATARTVSPVWFCVQPDRSLLRDSLRHLVAETDGPFVVLTPGAIGDGDLVQILRLRHACYLPLCETIDIDDTNKLRAIQPTDLLLRKFREAVTAYEAGDRRQDAYTFRREGRVWILTFKASTEYVPHRDASGLAYIHQLLQRPYTDVEVTELEELVSGDVRVRAARDAGETVDDEGRHAIRERYRAVGGTWEEDEDGSEAAALKARLDAVEGLGGRPRRDADQVDRLRVRITNLITRAIQAVADPKLALHLDNSIRRGRSMRYTPESPVEWVL
jgi:hypothetical protein